MSTATLSGWQRFARAEFPQGNLVGDGPFALTPCVPTGKVYLFFTKAEALAVADHWPCQSMCFGNHKVIELRPARNPRPAAPVGKSSYVWERDRHERPAK
jgi:hypothetical protein